MIQFKVWPLIIGGTLTVVLPTVVGMTWPELPQEVGITIILLCIAISLVAAAWGLRWQPKWEKGWRPEWLQAALSLRVVFFDERKRQFVPLGSHNASETHNESARLDEAVSRTPSLRVDAGARNSNAEPPISLKMLQSTTTADAIRALGRGNGDSNASFNQHLRPADASLVIIPTNQGFDFKFRVGIENRSRLKLKIKIREPKWEVCKQTPQTKSEQYSSSDCAGSPTSRCTFTTGRMLIYEPPDAFSASVALRVYFGVDGREFFDQMFEVCYAFTVTGFQEFVSNRHLKTGKELNFEGIEVKQQYLQYYDASSTRQDSFDV